MIRFGEWTLQHASPSDCLLASLATQQLCKWAGRASHSLRTAVGYKIVQGIAFLMHTNVGCGVSLQRKKSTCD